MSKDKHELCKTLASLTFTEKIKILEKLRHRSRLIAASGLRPKESARHPEEK